MRARNIKPGFFKNEYLAECSPLARILFAGLWCMADREGRLEYRPKRIKAEILPYDNASIEKLISELQDRRFLQIYDADGERYLNIINFRKHQNPHVRESESVCPAPDKPGAKHCQGDAEHRTSPADSPILNPDSPIPHPDSPILNPPIPPKPNHKKIPYQEIIEYLNLKTGKHFSNTAKETRSKIKARWGSNGQQRTIQDFKTVIDNKCAQWLNDEKMSAFLRPETLFGTKFESYLNERIHPLSGRVSDKTIQNMEMLKDWRPPT